MKSGGRLFWSIIIFLFIGTQALAAGVGTTGANYLKIDSGARSAALGSAYVGLADDLNALYWNPAGIASIPYPAVDAMQLNWLADITQQQLAGIYPLGEWGVLGGYFSKLSTPYDKETVYESEAKPQYHETGDNFNSEIKVVDLTYAKKLNSKLSVGLGVKQIQERLADVKKEGLGLDASLLYKGLVLPDLSLGLVLQNYSLTPLREEEPLPQTLILGAAYTFRFSKEQKLILLGDVGFPNDNTAFYGLGVEYSLNKYLAFRIGYKDKVGATLGGGLYLGNFKLNYAYVPFGDLGTAYRVAIGYDFNNVRDVFDKAEEEKPSAEKIKETENTLFEEKQGIEKAPVPATPSVVTEEIKMIEEKVSPDVKGSEAVPSASTSKELEDLFAD